MEMSLQYGKLKEPWAGALTPAAPGFWKRASRACGWCGWDVSFKARNTHQIDCDCRSCPQSYHDTITLRQKSTLHRMQAGRNHSRDRVCDLNGWDGHEAAAQPVHELAEFEHAATQQLRQLRGKLHQARCARVLQPVCLDVLVHQLQGQQAAGGAKWCVIYEQLSDRAC